MARRTLSVIHFAVFAAVATPAAAQLIDNTFNAVVTGTVIHAVIRQVDGKILVGGQFTQVNGVTKNGLARLNADGSLDAAFTAGPNTGYVNSIAIQPDGKILVAGYWGNFNGVPRENLVRLNADGMLDATFTAGPMSEPFKVLVQPDGKIVVAGNMFAVHGGGLQRLNPDGSREGGFAPGPNNIVFDAVLQQDGAILFGGQFSTVGGITRNGIARVHANGSLDSSFDPNANNAVRALAIRPDGKIVVGGQFTYIAGDFRNRVALLNPDGTRDPGFNPNANSTVREVAVQADGKTLLGGNFSAVGGVTAPMLTRVNSDGSVDLSFVPFAPTATGSIRSIFIQPDERILAAGDFGLNNIIRFLPRPPTPNQPPIITPPPNQSVVDQGAGVTTPPLPFTVSDPEGQPVTVTATSSNPALLAPSGILLTGTGSNRAISLSTTAGIGGVTTITLVASDGVTTATATFTLTVTLQSAPARNLVAVVARSQVTLTWLPPLSAQPATGYVLEVGFGPGATAITLPVGNVLTFSAVAPDGRYYARVRAQTAGGPAPPSNEVQFSTGQAGPPLAPLSLLATVVGTNVTLQWTENALGPAVTGYQLHAGSAPGQSNIASIPLPGGVRTLGAGAPAGTYFVRVHASNAAGTGPASNEVTLTTGPGICTIAETPVGLVATVSGGTVSIAWNAPVSGAIPTGYRLDAGSTPGASNIGSFPLPPGTGLSAPVPPGTYFIRLAATNQCGSSAPSLEISFVIP